MIIDDILEQAVCNPAHIAYRSGQGSLNYDQLCNYARRIATSCFNTLPPKIPVMVYGHKELLMPVCFLAASLSGRAYIPVDVSTPLARIRQMAEQAKPAAVCALSPIFLTDCRVITKNELWTVCQSGLDIPIAPTMDPEDTYYIIFTSGSTGTPKGVRVSYRNVCGFVSWLRGLVKTREGGILNQSIFSFDLSVADLYLALTVGRTLSVLDNKTQQNFPLLLSSIQEADPTLAVMTPSFAEYLLGDRAFGAALLHLREIFFCGESLHSSLACRLFERFPGIRILNAYGPTECTVAVSAAEIHPNNLPDGPLPIGLPRSGTEFILLNDEGESAENETGQLLIVGDSVAQGYLKAAGGFCTYRGRPAYQTGDIACQRGGTYYIKGRKDHQIKYKGYRIELEDIEENLCAMAYIKQAAVIPVRDQEGRVTRLVAFVCLAEPKSAQQIRQDLSERLPDYMLPQIRWLERFPLTPNGKCDKEQLEAMLCKQP